MHLRQLLEKIGSVTGMTSEEKGKRVLEGETLLIKSNFSFKILKSC